MEAERTKSPNDEEKKDEEANEDNDKSKEDEDKIEKTEPTIEEKDEPLVERWIESDQDDRVALTANRVALQQPGYHVLLMNQFAARAHRQDFLAQILRVTYDFFVDNVNA